MIAEALERVGIGVVIASVYFVSPTVALGMVGLWIIAEAYRWKD